MPPHRATVAPWINVQVLPSLRPAVPSAALTHHRSSIGLPQSPVLCRFQRQSRTKAPSLRRHYPASSVIRASPPPHSAPSSRHRHQVGRHDRPRYRASRVARVLPLCTCHRHYPGTATGCSHRSLPQPCQPSPHGLTGRPVHRPFRGLLSVHSRYGLHTRQATICDPLHQRLQPLRYLHDCSDCFRPERQLPGGTCTH